VRKSASLTPEDTLYRLTHNNYRVVIKDLFVSAIPFFALKRRAADIHPPWLSA
jgi:hypothetical protein